MHPWLHFKTITRHKLLVMKYCFRIGLYKQGLLHDLSKYSPTEFLVGCRYYQGNRSPNNAEREATGYSKAWLHHKGRNKHHYEYWIDYSINPTGGKLVGMKMPKKYVAEMFCDRLAASKVYRGQDFQPGDPYQFFQYGKKKRLLMHPATSELLETILIVLRDQGEDAAFDYVRREVLGKK